MRIAKRNLNQEALLSRPIGELITVLGEDFEWLAEQVLSATKRGGLKKRDLTHARNLVRCLFALVEGVSFAAKFEAFRKYIEEGRKDIRGIEDIVFEERYEVDDKGGITIQPLKITMEKNVKLAFRLYSEIYNIPNFLDINSKWWAALKRSSKVRDRLMHPRTPQDLDITEKEIVDVLEAEKGFRDLVWKMLQTKSLKLLQNL